MIKTKHVQEKKKGMFRDLCKIVPVLAAVLAAILLAFVFAIWHLKPKANGIFTGSLAALGAFVFICLCVCFVWALIAMVVLWWQTSPSVQALSEETQSLLIHSAGFLTFSSIAGFCFWKGWSLGRGLAFILSWTGRHKISAPTSAEGWGLGFCVSFFCACAFFYDYINGIKTKTNPELKK